MVYADPLKPGVTQSPLPRPRGSSATPAGSLDPSANRHTTRAEAVGGGRTKSLQGEELYDCRIPDYREDDSDHQLQSLCQSTTIREQPYTDHGIPKAQAEGLVALMNNHPNPSSAGVSLEQSVIPPLPDSDEEWDDSSSNASMLSYFDPENLDAEMSDIPSMPMGKGKGAQSTSESIPRATAAGMSPSYSDVARPWSTSRPQGLSSSNNQSTRWNPPPTFGQHSSTSSRTPPFCVICKSRPSYSRNGKSYPTCGLTCAAELEDKKKRDAWSSGRPSKHPGPCEVCHDRPKHVSASSGRVYPTCGLRCAAERDPAKFSAGMCTVCKKRPKLATETGKFYDQCSARCRDKAKAALANAVTVTCDACLACWRVRALPNQPFCSDDCKTAMLGLAPALIEMPRGHALFDKYNTKFQTGWQTPSQRGVVARHMYFFAQAPPVISRFGIYKGALESSLHGKSAAETEAWIAVTRECNVGDSGSVTICSSPRCQFCNIMLNGFTRTAHPDGVKASLTAAKASEASSSRQGSTKALLFCKVIHVPRLPEYTAVYLPSPQRSRDPVVAVLPVSWARAPTGLRIYNPDAILPLGLLIYSEK